jgi:hypothetical protein
MGSANLEGKKLDEQNEMVSVSHGFFLTTDDRMTRMDGEEGMGFAD